MNYKKELIKDGINLHIINTSKFKTNLCTLMLTSPIEKENVTKNALISLILRRGTKNFETQEDLSKKFENMYGANFDCGIEKMGDNHVLKFFIESINDDYIIENNNNLKDCIDLLLEIVFNPYIENGKFKQEYFEQEKAKLKQIIEAKKDNKALYALNRCIEEMYKNKPFGVYKFGSLEDLDKINNEDLYEYYISLISNCKIDIFVSGNIDVSIKNIIEDNDNIANLNWREAKIITNSKEVYDENIKENVIIEKLDITQGKLIIGLNENEDVNNGQNIALIYNAILGGTANSKLFQNVREKASLAYTVSSNYLKSKACIFIRSGIEIENFDKALDIIKKQIDDMKNGEFSDDDVNIVKQFVYSGIDQIEDEQDTAIIYYFNQELNDEFVSLEDYRSGIEKVSKDDIVKFANFVKIGTIYFLRN